MILFSNFFISGPWVKKLDLRTFVTSNISDFVILGGGCSALSFINQVLEKKITKYSFIIIEKQKKYADDKSWCFWSDNIKKTKNIIEASWSSFSFNLDNRGCAQWCPTRTAILYSLRNCAKS